MEAIISGLFSFDWSDCQDGLKHSSFICLDRHDSPGIQTCKIKIMLCKLAAAKWCFKILKLPDSHVKKALCKVNIAETQVIKIFF